MTGIRVTYSGLIAFGVRILSIFTGLIFTVIVTRQLTPEEFGTWGLINGILIYALIINPIINYWVTREIARAENTSSTAMFSSGIFSGAGVVIYLISAYIIGIQSNADLGTLFFAAILIPMIFIHNCFGAINQGYKPQINSYGMLAFEIVKIPSGLIFVYFNQLGVEGAIISTFLAYVSSIFVQGYFSRKKFRSSIQKKHLKKWLKLFWIPTYRRVPSIIQMSDVTVFSVMTGSVLGVAYFTAAKTIGMLVNHVRAFSTALYPKLLESEKEEFLQENLIKLFYFSFPLIAFSITFAEAGLFVLNPAYQIAAPLVLFISIKMFLKTLNQVFFEALQGIEKIDKNENSTFKEYLKSKLIWIPTFDLIRHAVYIGLLAVLLFILVSRTDSMIDLVLYWSVIGVLIEIPLTIYVIRVTKKSFKLKIDMKSSLKYLLTTIVIFGVIGIIMQEYLIFEESIFEFLPSLLPYLICSIVGYFGITYLIDYRTKVLFKAIWNEVLKKRI